MTETTTIEIPKTQRDELKDLKQNNREPYYEVIARLLDAQAAADDAETPDVSEQLDRIEAAAREATQAAQNAETAITEATQR